MGAAEPTLNRLREAIAGLDPTLRHFAEPGRTIRLEASIDAVLGSGLSCGALHEIAPTAPLHLPAASGFAVAIAALASGERREVLWITTDFAVSEGGGPYGPGLELFGLSPGRLIVLRVRRAVDVLWAMEEGLRCRGLAGVIAELTGRGEDADLTATRRLVLAARDGVSAEPSGVGLLLRHQSIAAPSAAATRWRIAAAASEPDAFGGLGRAAFDISLLKNRRGPCGRWLITWDHHEHVFQPAISLGVAAPPLHRSDRALLRHAG